MTFGIAICHEAFRYPEIARVARPAKARRSSSCPHYVTTEDGSAARAAGATPSNPYNEKAVLLRAIENTVFVAAANVAGPDQGSLTCIIAPDGPQVASLDYGRVGVVAADIDLDIAELPCGSPSAGRPSETPRQIAPRR